MHVFCWKWVVACIYIYLAIDTDFLIAYLNAVFVPAFASILICSPTILLCPALSSFLCLIPPS